MVHKFEPNQAIGQHSSQPLTYVMVLPILIVKI
jgi:hypothetical protein